MKKVLLICLLFAPCIVGAQTWMSTNGDSAEMDRFSLTLSSGGKSCEIALRVDNRYSATFDSKDDQSIDEFRFCRFTTIVYDSRGNLTKCERDTRGQNEYANNYCVEFPLYAEMAKDNTTQYTLHLDEEGYFGTAKLPVNSKNKAATVVSLIDKQHPDLFINLLEGNYTFTSETGEGTDRFALRVYAGCLWKKEKTSGDWNDVNNWHGGIPGKGSSNEWLSNRTNNCAIIPEGVEVSLSEDITIGSLINSGKLTIEEGNTLTVKKDAKLISVSNIY